MELCTQVDGMQGSVTLRGAESKFGHGVWGGGGLSATFPQPLSDPTAAADAHAHVEQPERHGRSKR
ncbi:hypothetical protein HaLaN_30710 [Haematococcus lacustris]|uniref:Uncharacterized protein n=1 Tax=Haematococcus lacustris TaxID=44745 RepID=A0A6A0AHD7_HAELA|nr:hypothetical protein HaLaN_30710 [Haematococcus lacustris]